MANFFEGSLDELKKRSPGLDTRFRRLDANHFQAAIYENGKSQARCKIWLNVGGFPNGIAYAHNESISSNAINESLSVEHDEQSLFLRALGMASYGQNRDVKFTAEGAGEYFWSIFIRLLQS